LRDEDYGVRTRAAAGLGQVGGSEAALPLIAALRQDTSNAAGKALDALGDRHGVEPYLKGLVKALRQKDLDARPDAVVALRRLLAQRMSREREPNDPATVDALIVALNDDDAEVRSQAAGMLGELGDSRAVMPLIATLQDEGSGVSAAATWALGELGDKRAVEPLRSAFRSGAGNPISIMVRSRSSATSNR
jgi:HEAT repeat protein